MFARADGTKVRVGFHPEDPAVYAKVLAELTEAEKDHEAHRTELSTVELRPYAERLQAAEDDFAELFAETLTVAAAEAVLRSLSKAITRAKINRGDYQYDKDADIIPFPYSTPPRPAA